MIPKEFKKVDVLKSYLMTMTKENLIGLIIGMNSKVEPKHIQRLAEYISKKEGENK